jgi:hypothetical protein
MICPASFLQSQKGPQAINIGHHANQGAGIDDWQAAEFMLQQETRGMYHIHVRAYRYDLPGHTAADRRGIHLIGNLTAAQGRRWRGHRRTDIAVRHHPNELPVGHHGQMPYTLVAHTPLSVGK